MSVVVVAVITPLDGHIPDIVEAFAAVSPLVHAEGGCELYALHHDADQVVMIERWATAADLAAHAAGEPIAELNSRLAGHINGAADVSVLENVPLGDTMKGTIQ